MNLGRIAIKLFVTLMVLLGAIFTESYCTTLLTMANTAAVLFGVATGCLLAALVIVILVKLWKKGIYTS